MFACYVGGYDCGADVIREEGWEPEAVFDSLEEAFDYCEEHAQYDDTGWIEHDGVLREFFYWER